MGKWRAVIFWETIVKFLGWGKALKIVDRKRLGRKGSTLQLLNMICKILVDWQFLDLELILTRDSQTFISKTCVDLDLPFRLTQHHFLINPSKATGSQANFHLLFTIKCIQGKFFCAAESGFLEESRNNVDYFPCNASHFPPRCRSHILGRKSRNFFIAERKLICH